MAAAKFACPSCQTVLQLSQAPPPGAKIRCPKCQAVFAVRVPAPAPVITAQKAAAVGGSGTHVPAKAGGSSLKMRGPVPASPSAAPLPGRSSMKIKAAAPPPPSPPPGTEEEYDLGPVRKPKRKKQNRDKTMIAVFAGLGGLLFLIIVVVVLIVFVFPGNTSDADDIRTEFERAKERIQRERPRSDTRASTNPAPPQPAPGGEGDPRSEAPPLNAPDRPVSSDGSGDGNPFINLNVGNLPARAPRDLETVRFLPERAETVMFADFAAVRGQPAVADLLMNLFVTPDLAESHPLARMGKITPPPQLDHILATVRYGNLSAALANPAQAGAAVEFTTVLFHLRNKVDQSRLVRALKAEEGPQVGGFVCHRLPIVDYAGAKLHSFLFFPEADERTVLVALALKDDAFPLVSSGGGMNPTMQAILTALEPGHFWMALSLESFKPLLTMATMAAGSNLPPEFAGELKPILTELPKARGLFFHTRLVDNVVRASVALSFETQGPGGTISTSLSSLWNSKLKQTVQAAGANSKIAADIARTLRVAVRGTAVNVNIQLTTAALAADYPMMAASLRNLPAMSVPMTAAGTPGAMGPSGAEVPPSPGKTPPPNTTEPMTPSDGSPSSPRTMLGRSRSNPNAPYGLEVNLRAPDIEGTDAEGKRFKLSDYKGKIIVLDFWGYWCPPCRSMLPHERELVERLQNEPFVFLGVNTDLRVNFNREKTKDPVTWRNFMDGQRGPICQKYKIEAYPTLFLIDANMVIRHKFVGVPPNNVLDKAIDDLIAELKGR